MNNGMKWMILGALRYIRFHKWAGDRRFQSAAVDRGGLVQ